MRKKNIFQSIFKVQSELEKAKSAIFYLFNFTCLYLYSLQTLSKHIKKLEINKI